jgi:DNA primase
MDFLQLYQHGYTNVVAGSGTAFTDEHARLLRRFADEAILCYDSDNAGQKAAVRTGFSVSSQKLECRVLVLPDGEDPDSYLQKEGAEGFFKKEASALSFFDFLRQYYKPTTMSAKVKSETITQLLENIHNFSDPVYREMFAREIAKLFLVDEQTLLTQLNRQNRPGRKTEKNIFMGEKPKQFKNQGESAEYFLLQLLVNGNLTVRKAGVRYLSPVLFKHPFLKQVLDSILQVLEKNISIIAGHIPDKIQDDKIRNFIIKLLMEEQNLKNQEQIFVESLKQIEMQMLKDDYNELTETLRSATAEEIADIMKKQMENIQQRKQLNNQYTMDIFQEIEV